MFVVIVVMYLSDSCTNSMIGHKSVANTEKQFDMQPLINQKSECSVDHSPCDKHYIDIVQ